MSFDHFQFDPALRAGIAASGFITPTPIQAQAIPEILKGRDVLGLAQTGTGKTAAFALPVLQRLLSGPRGKLRALVLAPTRELAEQTHVAFGKLGRDSGIRSAAIYGGASMNHQRQALKGRAEIAVACPGRLLDHLNGSTADLSRVEVVVLDEADQMLDMGFLPDMRKIMIRLHWSHQTLLFSATMSEEIRWLAHEWLQNPAIIAIQHTAPLQTVSHALFPVGEHLKAELLQELLRRTGSGSVLVFTRTKHRAKRLGEKLQKAGFAASSLQGNLSQNKRRAAMDGFRDGSYRILVATDIAARGIDVSQVTHVINYDVPLTPVAYTHRIGRTGRAARSGDAFTLITDDDAPLIREIERLMKCRIERRQIEGFEYAKAATHAPRPPVRANRPDEGRPLRYPGRRHR